MMSLHCESRPLHAEWKTIFIDCRSVQSEQYFSNKFFIVRPECSYAVSWASELLRPKGPCTSFGTLHFTTVLEWYVTFDNLVHGPNLLIHLTIRKLTCRVISHTKSMFSVYIYQFEPPNSIILLIPYLISIKSRTKKQILWNPCFLYLWIV